MLDIKSSGLDAEYDAETKTLILEGKKIEPAIRTIGDIKEVLSDHKWYGNQEASKGIYYMYRGVAKKEHQKTIEDNKLRYDITVIPPGSFGREYAKTAGHNHPLVPGTKYTYTELYEVVKGEAIYLMQKTEKDKVVDAYIIHAKEKDIIIIPPGYAHITVNPGKDILVMANWVSSAFKSEYEEIKTHKGSCIYVETERIVKNPLYKNSKKTVRVMKPNRHELLGLKDWEPIYTLINDPFRLGFLNDPAAHQRIFSFLTEIPAGEEQLSEDKHPKQENKEAKKPEEKQKNQNQ